VHFPLRNRLLGDQRGELTSRGVATLLAVATALAIGKTGSDIQEATGWTMQDIAARGVCFAFRWSGEDEKYAECSEVRDAGDYQSIDPGQETLDMQQVARLGLCNHLYRSDADRRACTSADTAEPQRRSREGGSVQLPLDVNATVNATVNVQIGGGSTPTGGSSSTSSAPSAPDGEAPSTSRTDTSAPSPGNGDTRTTVFRAIQRAFRGKTSLGDSRDDVCRAFEKDRKETLATIERETGLLPGHRRSLAYNLELSCNAFGPL
jgi:hypothetical protein